MNAEQAAEALTEYRRITEHRDTRVHDAFAAGLTKMEIHDLSGLGRATIDRILDKPRPKQRKSSSQTG